MNDEFSDRHPAIKLRLAGQSVESICQRLGRSREWFHTGWRRDPALGPAGLFDLSHARQQLPQLSPELERTLLNIRRRLESPLPPFTRYDWIGAGAIQAELKDLRIQPLPCLRTIERVLQRNGVTLPRVRLARLLPEYVYPAPSAHDSHQLHQLD